MPEIPRWFEIALIVFSVAMFVGSIVAIPIAIRRLPADHFVRPPAGAPLWKKLLRNTVGAIIVALGIAMLVLPGQGVIAILFGLSVMDLAVKDRIVRRLLCQKRIQEAVQRIRSRAGKPPLAIPEHPITA